MLNESAYVYFQQFLEFFNRFLFLSLLFWNCYANAEAKSAVCALDYSHFCVLWLQV